jgi:ribosomal protein S18 acetylase RimI-like enzyme
MNVAVLESFRKKGVAKALTASCVNKFRDKILFLGTEEDSVNEKIYKKMGFETVGIGRCYKENK